MCGKRGRILQSKIMAGVISRSEIRLLMTSRGRDFRWFIVTKPAGVSLQKVVDDQDNRRPAHRGRCVAKLHCPLPAHCVLQLW